MSEIVGAASKIKGAVTEIFKVTHSHDVALTVGEFPLVAKDSAGHYARTNIELNDYVEIDALLFPDKDGLKLEVYNKSAIAVHKSAKTAADKPVIIEGNVHSSFPVKCQALAIENRMVFAVGEAYTALTEGHLNEGEYLKFSATAIPQLAYGAYLIKGEDDIISWKHKP